MWILPKGILLIILRRAPSQQWSMVVADSYCGDGIHQQGLGNWSELMESYMEQNIEKTLWENSWSLSAGDGGSASSGTDPKETAKVTHKRFKVKYVKYPGMVQAKSKLKSSEESLVTFKDFWAKAESTQLKGAGAVLLWRMDKTPRTGQMKLQEMYLERLDAVTTTKCGSTDFGWQRLTDLFWQLKQCADRF